MLLRLRLFRLAFEESDTDDEDEERTGECKPDAEVEAKELRDKGVIDKVKEELWPRGDLSSRGGGEGVLDDRIGAEERGKERKGRTKRKSFMALPWTLTSKRLAKSAADLHR